MERLLNFHELMPIWPLLIIVTTTTATGAWRTVGFKLIFSEMGLGYRTGAGRRDFSGKFGDSRPGGRLHGVPAARAEPGRLSVLGQPRRQSTKPERPTPSRPPSFPYTRYLVPGGPSAPPPIPIGR